MATLTQEMLKEKFNYDPDTGVFTYRSDAGRGVKKGDVAGFVPIQGSRRIFINRRYYSDGVLAIMYMMGKYHSHHGRHDRNQLNTKYNNLFPSDKKIIYTPNCGYKKKVGIIKKAEIINALEGYALNLDDLIRKTNCKKSEEFKIHELHRDGFIKLNHDTECFFISGKGHAEIMRYGNFSDSDSIYIFFQSILTGKLTTSAEKPYFC